LRAERQRRLGLTLARIEPHPEDRGWMDAGARTVQESSSSRELSTKVPTDESRRVGASTLRRPAPAGRSSTEDTHVAPTPPGLAVVDSSTVTVTPEARPSGADLTPADLEPYRRELTGYCYRMLGSVFEADDAVQETMVKAWRSLDGFEGRSSVRSWIYRIATNVCLDSLRGRNRRARPMDLGPSSPADSALGTPIAENLWVEPIPDGRVVPTDADPAEAAAARESIRLAFVAALQHLPAKQRAVLILREVLRWQATEVAELLDTTVASVNSALQRARATLGSLDDASRVADPVDPAQQELLARYVDAFERYDIPLLVELLHDDAIMSMPPFPLWLTGSDQIADFFVGHGIGCKGSRLVATVANGRAAFGSYKIDPEGGWAPWGIQLIEVREGRIAAHHNFLDTNLFAAFGLPAHLD
jgi:RNA polymerase sigma-70 factor (ECF subfamily)